jgi:flavin-dependent dehydrogenase
LKTVEAAERVDVIIVGAGPGGLTAAKTIIDAKPDTRIVVLERGPPLSAYKEKGYGDALLYSVATSDPDFREDVEGTPIVVGNGVGGGKSSGSIAPYHILFLLCDVFSS